MQIKVRRLEIDYLDGFSPLTSIDQITEGVELYYELGEKYNAKKGPEDGNWRRSGYFKKIKDPMLFKEKEQIPLNDPEYLQHHNFMYK